ncbi:MAG: Na/Pi cotransporter, partial [Spirochaetales bacterium]
TGAGVTALIQSSSATTVLLVSLVNAGLVTLKQSIGVIMGANIGTTLTAWVISLVGFKFNIASVALPAVAIGLPLYFSRSVKRRETADILIGFGLLFLGLGFMKDAVPDIKNNPDVLMFLSDWSSWGFASTLLFVGIGTVLTVVVQSSSAAMTITITMAFRGWIDFPVAAAVILGENIGTTITAFLASLPMNATAKRAARAHMVFNIIGVLWMLLVFRRFTGMIENIIPGDASNPAYIPVHLSMFHSTFNILNSFLLIGFVGPLSRLVEKMVKEDKPVSSSYAQPYKLHLVPENFADAIDSNLITIRRELVKMAAEAYGMLTMVIKGSREPKTFDKQFEELALREQRVDDMQEEIIAYLTHCTYYGLGESQAVVVSAFRRVAHELESVADSTFGIGLLVGRLHKKEWEFHKSGDEELMKYTLMVLDFLRYNQDFLDRKFSDYDLDLARQMEDGIDRMRNKLRKRSRKTIEKNEKVDVKGELLFMDIVRHLEHIGDSSLNISEAIVELP